MIDIPGYKVKAEIGSGGMATAYLAIQESLDREVALKVMAPALAADRAFSQRFLREARTIASLDHPNIVPIFEIGVTDDQLHFFSMQYLQGGDFAARIRAGVPEAELIRILRGVAYALGFAHNQGFVHRDVTPGNVLFDASGTPILTDFGIARAVTQATRITGTGMSVGTSHYMSPEQARGGSVDGRSDLYSLGALAYEALTGEPPFDGADGFAVAYSHVFDPIPDLPDEWFHWQALVDRAMAKDPNERFADADEFIEELQRLESGEAQREIEAAGGPAAIRAAAGNTSWPTSPWLKLWRRAWRLPGLSAVPRNLRSLAAVTLPFLLIAIVAIGFGLAGPDADSPEVPETAAQVEEDTPAVGEAEAPESRREESPDSLDQTPPPPEDELVMVDIDSGERISLSPDDAAPGASEDDEDLESADDDALIGEGEQPATTTMEVTPFSARNSEVARLLAAAADDMAARRLTTPPGESAFDRYQQILTIAPDNPDALDGLSQIVSNYLVLAESDLRAGRFPRLRTFLRRARTVIAADDNLQPMIRQVNQFADRAHESALAQARTEMDADNHSSAADLFRHALALNANSDEARAGLTEAQRFAAMRVQDSLGDGTLGPQLIRIPPGQFTLGAPGGVEVIVDAPFAISTHEVTLAEYRRFADASGHYRNGADVPRCRVEEQGGMMFRRRRWDEPGFVQAPDHPVVCVTWRDARAYTAWLSTETGESYRLPSEAEWEYAATRLAWPDADPARCDADNVGDQSLAQKFGRRPHAECDDGFMRTAPVDAFPAAPNGLLGLIGNVREWTLDCLHETHEGRPQDRRARLDGDCDRRVVKGASWWSIPTDVYPAAREGMRADQSFGTVGFRVVRAVE